MGFTEILKKLGLSDLLNLVKIVVDNSKHIEIKDSTIIIETTSGNRNEYTLPNAVEFDDVREYVDKLYNRDVSGFVRKDLALPEVAMLASRLKHKEVFKRYKNRIKPEHYRSMLSAYAIIEFEDNGDFITSNDLFKKMLKRYGSDARHIYNFCRSGLMEGFFWNEIGFIMVEGATEPVIRTKFSKIFDDYVKFFPHAIWIAPAINFEDVIHELRIRLNRSEIQRLDIYFRGKEKKDLCEEVTELLDQKESLKIEAIERYTICNSPCIRLSIEKIHDKFKTF